MIIVSTFGQQFRGSTSSRFPATESLVEMPIAVMERSVDSKSFRTYEGNQRFGCDELTTQLFSPRKFVMIHFDESGALEATAEFRLTGVRDKVFRPISKPNFLRVVEPRNGGRRRNRRLPQLRIIRI